MCSDGIGGQDEAVPDDFPMDPFPAALSGAQPKVALRLIDGEHIAGLTDDERKGRYLMCVDLVDQLTSYAHRKHAERSDLTLTALLDEIGIAVHRKGWDVAKSELDWVMGRVRSSVL